jgi:hypothetical protein
MTEAVTEEAKKRSALFISKNIIAGADFRKRSVVSRSEEGKGTEALVLHNMSPDPLHPTLPKTRTEIETLIKMKIEDLEFIAIYVASDLQRMTAIPRLPVRVEDLVGFPREKLVFFSFDPFEDVAEFLAKIGLNEVRIVASDIGGMQVMGKAVFDWIRHGTILSDRYD